MKVLDMNQVQEVNGGVLPAVPVAVVAVTVAVVWAKHVVGKK